MNETEPRGDLSIVQLEHGVPFFLHRDQNLVAQPPFDAIQRALNIPPDFFKDPSKPEENFAHLLYIAVKKPDWRNDVFNDSARPPVINLRKRIARWNSGIIVLGMKLNKQIEAYYGLDTYLKHCFSVGQYSTSGMPDPNGDAAQSFARFQHLKLKEVLPSLQDKMVGLGPLLDPMGMARQLPSRTTGTSQATHYFQLVVHSEALR